MDASPTPPSGGQLRRLWAPGVATAPARPAGATELVVIHRIAVSREDPALTDGPADVLRFFAEHPVGRAATGGRMPYPLLVDPAGVAWQLAPLDRQTPHVARLNGSALGLGVIGDFREHPPTQAQWTTLVGLARAVLAGLGLSGACLAAHDRLAGGSRDPEKVCPGRHLSVAELRRAVAAAPPTPQRPSDLVWA